MTKPTKGQRIATAHIKAQPIAPVVASIDGDDDRLLPFWVMALVESSTDFVALSTLDQRMTFLTSSPAHRARGFPV